MKKITFFLLIGLPTIIIAQTPLAFKYQGVINQNDGPINGLIAVRFSIIRDNTTILYQETHTHVQATNGQFSVNVGMGAVNVGSMKAIDWANGTYFLQTEVSPNNNFDFQSLGVSRLLAVPYAIYAEKAKESEQWKNGEDFNLYRLQGNVGIRTSDPKAPLHVMQTIRVDGTTTATKYYMVANNKDQDNVIRSDNENLEVMWRIIMGDRSSNDNFVIDRPGNGVAELYIDENAVTHVRVLEIHGGADIIEKSNSNESLQPGEVIVIDPSQHNHAKRCTKAYDRTVLGVVSGAGGMGHGMELSDTEMLDGNIPFAIAGRVYVKVTGEVEYGDLLTTSNVPGYAMVAKNRRKRDGAVIGKALSSPNENGLVLMLVMGR